jgi:CRISPR-associated endonuclease/helicase Cas3
MNGANKMDVPGEFYAHTKSGPNGPLPRTAWEPLFTPFGETPDFECQGGSCRKCADLDEKHGHLNKVAWWSAKFAAEMFPTGPEGEATRQWGYLAGLWHDLGKFSKEFQAYLANAGGDPHEGEIAKRVDHSTAGAKHGVLRMPVLGHLMAYGIAGHHSGLLDGEANHACQHERLLKSVPDVANAPMAILDFLAAKLPSFVTGSLRGSGAAGFTTGFFARMLFSCLVDADFLATEAFMNAGQASRRNVTDEDALMQIDQLVDARISGFGPPPEGDVVNLKRAEVVGNCRDAATKAPGFFTLTVPTGGGKTLSSLSFALKHALQHGMRRVIYVAPFTSIIEQNAQVMRDIVSPLETESFTPLIEHHSSLSPDDETLQSRLAAENWDAPIIVTTAVQFYESLFAAKTSRSRKLHNIANSVVILDEAQTLPVSFLDPCLRVLRELADNYRTTVVLCTATQPAIGYDEHEFPIGLKDCREIVADTKSLYAALKRVEVENRGPLTDADLVDELKSRPQALCIVNRRRHAQELFQQLGENAGNYHLSALMCPEHRSRILNEVRARLAANEPARVISTQLIEAGVDVDFPVVYRALAGLDSIAQAAGRCNRNGRLSALGRTHVFQPEDTKGEAYFRETAQVAGQVLDLHDDLLGGEAIRHYFDLYYYRNEKRWDEKKILERFRTVPGNRDFPFAFDFKSVAADFQLIDDWQVPVVIPFDERARKLIKELRNLTIPLHRNLLRGLQRYIVQISPRLLAENATAFESLRDDQFHSLISPELNYSEHFGLILNEEHANAQFLGVC